jgi:hypothetical protein
MTRLLFVLALISTLIPGCATIPEDMKSTHDSNLTAGMVKTTVIKGQTTQEDILKTFGAPNIVTKNRNNNEVWNYNRMSFNSVSGSDSGIILLWSGSRAMSSATTKSFDLVIIFDENDVVLDYSVISASF